MNLYLWIRALSFLFFACEIEPSDKINGQEEKLEPKLLISSSTDSVDISLYQIKGLPCPNSSTHAGGPWTYEEAESSKDEIYDMAITPKYMRWKNPTSGGAVHINPNDQIEVLQFTMGIYKGTIGDTALLMTEAPKDTFVIIPPEEIWPNVQGVGFGNETSVLITSEIPLKESKSFPKVMKELFSPGVQLYYLREK